MFSRSFLFVTLLAGQVFSFPTAISVSLVTRQSVVARQTVIPAEIEVKSDGTTIVPYSRRDEELPLVARQAVIPAEIAAKSDGTTIVPY